MRDLISNCQVTMPLAPVSINATNTPASGVDLKGFRGALVILGLGIMANVGASGGNVPAWYAALEHSDDDDSGFEAVTADDVILANGKNDGAISGAGVFASIDAAPEDASFFTVEYIGGKRYIRVVLTADDAPGATPASVTVIKVHPDKAPVSDA